MRRVGRGERVFLVTVPQNGFNPGDLIVSRPTNEERPLMLLRTLHRDVLGRLEALEELPTSVSAVLGREERARGRLAARLRALLGLGA